MVKFKLSSFVDKFLDVLAVIFGAVFGLFLVTFGFIVFWRCKNKEGVDISLAKARDKAKKNNEQIKLNDGSIGVAHDVANILNGRKD